MNELTSKFNYCNRARVNGPCITIGGSASASEGERSSSISLPLLPPFSPQSFLPSLLSQAHRLGAAQLGRHDQGLGATVAMSALPGNHFWLRAHSKIVALGHRRLPYRGLDAACRDGVGATIVQAVASREILLRERGERERRERELKSEREEGDGASMWPPHVSVL